MAFGVLDTGFNIKSYDNIYQDMVNSFQANFGADINVTPESPEGVIIGAVAEVASGLWEVAADAYNAFNPNATTGVSLQNVSSLNNIRQEVATATTVTVRFTGTIGTFIPLGTEVTTDPALTEGVTYVFNTASAGTVIAQTSPVGNYVDILCTRTTVGPLELNADTVTILSNPIPGITSITNPAASNTGQAEESDARLRARRNNTVALPAVSTVDAIVAGLNTIESVISVLGLENNTGSSTNIGGVTLLPYSIAFIVQGDQTTEEQNAIARTIYNRKDPGIPLNGTTTVPVTDSQGFSQDISFFYPTPVPIRIEVVTEALATNFPSDGVDLIKQAIIDYTEDPNTAFDVGDDVRFGRLYTPINSVPNHFVQSVKIKKVSDPNPATADDISITGSEIATFALTNIDVTLNFITEV